MSIHVQRPATGMRISATRRSGPGPLGAPYSWALGVIVLVATAYGLLVDGAYRVSPGVRSDFAETMRGQDLLTLLTVPVLLLSSRRARQGSLVCPAACSPAS